MFLPPACPIGLSCLGVGSVPRGQGQGFPVVCSPALVMAARKSLIRGHAVLQVANCANAAMSLIGLKLRPPLVTLSAACWCPTWSNSTSLIVKRHGQLRFRNVLRRPTYPSRAFVSGVEPLNIRRRILPF